MRNSLYKDIFYCHRLVDGERGFIEDAPTFSTPVKRRLSYTSVSSEMLLTTAGAASKRYLKARQNAFDEDTYAEGDRLYVYGTPPQTFDPLNPGCDFEVRSVNPGFRYTEILLEGLVDYSGT